MKLSGNRVIESIMSKKAKTMVEPIEGVIPFVQYNKPIKESTVALLTTAGVHLKTQDAFEVEAGDPTVRFIPASSSEDELMISHTHFDREDADKDVNCVFPLTRLKELQAAGVIGNVASTHYGLMGYIPETRLLVEETIPKIVKKLEEDQVDIVVLNPG